MIHYFFLQVDLLSHYGHDALTYINGKLDPKFHWLRQIVTTLRQFHWHLFSIGHCAWFYKWGKSRASAFPFHDPKSVFSNVEDYR